MIQRSIGVATTLIIATIFAVTGFWYLTIAFLIGLFIWYVNSESL